MEIFPLIDTDQFRLRLRAPDGTFIDRTEQIAIEALSSSIKQKVGTENVAITLGYVGMIPSSYPINAVYQWSRGPEEAILWVALKPGSGVDIEKLKEELRRELAQKHARCARLVRAGRHCERSDELRFANADRRVGQRREFRRQPRICRKAAAEIGRNSGAARFAILAIAGVSHGPSQCRPRKSRPERCHAAGGGAIAGDRHFSSSRFVVPNYWPDPKTGIGYQVQVEVPQAVTHSMDDLAAIPIKPTATGQLLLRDVARSRFRHHAGAIRSVQHEAASEPDGEYQRRRFRPSVTRSDQRHCRSR